MTLIRKMKMKWWRRSEKNLRCLFSFICDFFFSCVVPAWSSNARLPATDREGGENYVSRHDYYNPRNTTHGEQRLWPFNEDERLLNEHYRRIQASDRAQLRHSGKSLIINAAICNRYHHRYIIQNIVQLMMSASWQ